MSKLIIALSLLALLHFFIETVIAPTLRMGLRNKLFGLRDELRSLKIEGLQHCDEEAFWHVHDGINYFINRLPHLTMLNNASAIYAYKNDPELKKRIDQRIRMMEQAADPRLRSIYDRTSHVVEEAFVANMMMWVIYLLPVALTLFLVGGLKKGVKQLASSIIVAPVKDADRIFSHA